MWNKHTHKHYIAVKKQLKHNTTRVLGVFTLCMINVAAIISLRNLPLIAKYGFASVFFYLVAALVFFLPLAFITAELATTWPAEGGIYDWVKEAFGTRLGFLAIWLDWIINVVFFPTLLSFIAAGIAYTFNPAQAHNNLYIVIISLCLLWLVTFGNLFGAKLSGLISSIGVIFGTILPGILIIILAIAWLAKGHPSMIHFTAKTFLPDFTLSNLVFFAGVILGYAGIEVASYHAREAKNPQKDYPKAIIYAVMVIILIFCLGSLAIAIVVPEKDIGLVSGLLQAFTLFFTKFHIEYLMPYLGGLIAVGALAMLSTWVIGPSQGLIDTAQDGALPPRFQKTNRHGVPTFILLIQTILSSLFILVFLLSPNVNSAYWILTALASQTVVVMYILVFLAGLRLRYSQKDKPRPYRLPGGNSVMWCCSSIGILACIFTFILGFVPPSQIHTGGITSYELTMCIGIIILICPPIIISFFEKPSWKPTGAQPHD